MSWYYWMHDTGCLGLVHWDDPEGWYGEGGGRRVQDGASSTADPFASVSSRGQIREFSHLGLALNLVLIATHTTSPLWALLHHLCEVGLPSNDQEHPFTAIHVHIKDMHL